MIVPCDCAVFILKLVLSIMDVNPGSNAGGPGNPLLVLSPAFAAFSPSQRKNSSENPTSPFTSNVLVGVIVLTPNLVFVISANRNDTD